MMKKNLLNKTFHKTTIPFDWEIKTLADCCSNKGEYGINAAAVEYSENLPTYLRITDIDDDGNYSAVKKVSVDNDNSKNFILQNGDIVFARTGATVGKTYLYNKNDGELVFAGFLIRFKPKDNILLPEYLKGFTSTKLYWDWVKTVSMRSGQPGINAEEYGGLRIPVPTLNEQKAIAEMLNLIDKAVNLNNSLIENKEDQKQWLIQNLLRGKKRLQGFSDEWKKYSYEKLLKVVKRPVQWKDEELYKLISVRRRSGGIFFREALYGHQIKVKNLRTANEGDFLFSKMQILHGASALVTKELAGAKISGSYIAVVAKEPKILSMEYFNWIAQQKYFYHQTYISSYGVHIEKMTFDFEIFLSLDTKLPPLEEQTAIVKILQAADIEIQLLKTKTEKLKEKKKWLMQMLLTGKIRLNH